MNAIKTILQKMKKRYGKLNSPVNRNTIVELIRVELAVSDHNSILGVLWSLIVPVFMLVMMYLIFHGRFGQTVASYPLYLLVGIICVNFFVTATTYMVKAFSNNRDFFLNTTTPRENLLIAEMFIHAFKFTIEVIICAGICAFYVHMPLIAWLWLPAVFMAYVLFVLGVSLMLALLYCFARDIQHIWIIAGRLLFFVTPVFYSLDSLSSWGRHLVAVFNPLTIFLNAFRSVLLDGNNLQINAVVLSLTTGFAFFGAAYCAFLWLENTILERA